MTGTDPILGDLLLYYLYDQGARAALCELLANNWNLDSDLYAVANQFVHVITAARVIRRARWLPGADPPGYVGPALAPATTGQYEALVPHAPFSLHGLVVCVIEQHDGARLVVPEALCINLKGPVK